MPNGSCSIVTFADDAAGDGHCDHVDAPFAVACMFVSQIDIKKRQSVITD